MIMNKLISAIVQDLLKKHFEVQMINVQIANPFRIAVKLNTNHSNFNPIYCSIYKITIMLN